MPTMPLHVRCNSPTRNASWQQKNEGNIFVQSENGWEYGPEEGGIARAFAARALAELCAAPELHSTISRSGAAKALAQHGAEAVRPDLLTTTYWPFNHSHSIAHCCNSSTLACCPLGQISHTLQLDLYYGDAKSRISICNWAMLSAGGGEQD